MKFFLVAYGRRHGRLLDMQEFREDERARALEERFKREVKERNRPDVEVVLLGAESREDLERTHARYFKTLEEIAAST
jgi:hypothetical protein